MSTETTKATAELNFEEKQAEQTAQERPNIYAQLLYIQQNLNAPKDLVNNFGNYKYRSCESILQAVKPLLQDKQVDLLLQDEIVLIGDRYYVKSTATLINVLGDEVAACGYAREDLAKKGMDGAQLSGATSSYARKYALSALFAIDDAKDSDARNTHKTDKKSLIEEAMYEITIATTTAQVKSIYNKYKQIDETICATQGKFYKAMIARGKELKELESKTDN